MIDLTAKESAVAPVPKAVLVWNYYDHEHVVGTHYRHYEKVQILAEERDWALLVRVTKLPFIPVRLSALNFMYSPNDNHMRSFYRGSLGLILRQDFHFEDLGPTGSRVTVESRVSVPRALGFLQPLFARLMHKWFVDVWAEDMPMRERRLKLWRLGFKDFVGLDYVNNREKGPDQPDYARLYTLRLPLPKVSNIKSSGVERPFRMNEELGYGLPELPNE
jgi:hypothetical protein